MVKKEKEVKNKTIYEIGYLLDPSTGEEEIAPLISVIKEIIESYNVVFVSEGWPKKRSLSYSMFVSRDGKKKEFVSAFFGWLKYEVTPSDIDSIKSKLKNNSFIIRFLIIKTTREDIAPFEPKIAKVPAKDKKEPISISKEELDKTIEELVIE